MSHEDAARTAAEAAGERGRFAPDDSAGGGAPRGGAHSYTRLYLLVIVALAADIAFLAWLTGHWQ